MANEVQALEQLWGADLGDACIIASVAAAGMIGFIGLVEIGRAHV